MNPLIPMSDKSFIISSVSLFLTLVAVFGIASRGQPVVVKTNLENIPMQIGGYTATQDSFPKSVYDELNADKNIYRHYRSPAGRVIDLYIGYYGTAKGGRTGHNPYACLPGAGWGIVDTGKVKIPVKYRSRPMEVNYTIARKGDVYNIMLHWYQSEGTLVINSGLEQNIRGFFSRIMKNRNDGAFVQVSTFARKGEIDRTVSRVKDLSKEVLALLPEHWPEEKNS